MLTFDSYKFTSYLNRLLALEDRLHDLEGQQASSSRARRDLSSDNNVRGFFSNFRFSSLQKKLVLFTLFRFYIENQQKRDFRQEKEILETR